MLQCTYDPVAWGFFCSYRDVSARLALIKKKKSSHPHQCKEGGMMRIGREKGRLLRSHSDSTSEVNGSKGMALKLKDRNTDLEKARGL